MTDCPHCRRPVDGLFCAHCAPLAPRNPPIPAAAKAKIDAIIGRHRRPPDLETQLERAAIQDEAA